MTDFLLDYVLNNTGRVIHKLPHYCGIYEENLARFRGREPTVLEIGVRDGGSAQMWKAYFGPGARYHGLDVDPRCAAAAEPGIEIHIGDGGNREYLSGLAAAIGPLDIVIDDGSHTMADQIAAFETLYPLLSETGVYLCEDTHTSYWPAFGGGMPGAPDTFLAYMRAATDELSAVHWSDEVLNFTFVTRAIKFYDSVVVIEKGRQLPRVAAHKGEVRIIAESAT